MRTTWARPYKQSEANRRKDFCDGPARYARLSHSQPMPGQSRRYATQLPMDGSMGVIARSAPRGGGLVGVGRSSACKRCPACWAQVVIGKTEVSPRSD